MRGWQTDKTAIQAKGMARREARQAKLSAFEKADAKEAKIRESLRQKTAPELRLDQWLESTVKFPDKHRICRLLRAKAPRLLQWLWGTLALDTIAALPFHRPPETWEPEGKSPERLFRSFCTHLFARFHMPAFLWSAFLDKRASDFALFVVFVAEGGSVFGAVKQGYLGVPLTRPMCHALMATPSDVPFFMALRCAALGKKPVDRFLKAWVASPAGRDLHELAEETFWLGVAEWFGRHDMVDARQVGPLVDYIIFRRRQDAAFTMKGRTVLAMIRAMEEWHADLAKAKAIQGSRFKPTGFHGLTVHREEMVWRIDEILTPKALAEEGRVLRHCVYSYAHSIEAGRTSIWSLNKENPVTGDREKLATIELLNESRQIVQFRGKANRAATAKENNLLLQWAGLNELTVGRRWL